MKRYNLAAKTYDALYSEEQKTKYEAILPKIRLSTSDVVLDLGCGTGLLIPQLAPRTKHLVGIDFSIRMLELAKARSLSFDNVDLVLADAESLPIRDDTFSKILAFTLLQNVPNKKKALTEIKRVGDSRSIKVVTLLKKEEKNLLKEISKDQKFRIVSTHKSGSLKDVILICK